ncbi:MAG: hypothetical protein LBP22_09650 [Deltaproteobacteria bacterium]|nr:hypothetical protein [Deltaproteobacteria bacterium]
MTKILFFILCLLIAAVPWPEHPAWAEKKYLTSKTGQIQCPKEPLGGISADRSGQIKCGRGTCLTDKSGTVRCSSVSGGGAGINSAGEIKCEGGCSFGSVSECLTLY